MPTRLSTLRRLAPHLSLAALLGCAPVVRPADFRGARDQVTDASLVGPFDGQILDATTGEPLQDAVVMGVWSYDYGDGFASPHGSESVEVHTDAAGRYRIDAAPMRIRGASVRLVAFHLLVYKRGYQAYRSDTVWEGGKRSDFTGRHSRIELDKWRDRDSHADHLLFLAGTPAIAKAARWESHLANRDLYESLRGEAAPPEPSLLLSGASSSNDGKSELLDVESVMSAEDLVVRTGYDGEFEIGSLGDLQQTSFYDDVHFQAVDRDETFDFAYRVWVKPPAGLDAEVVATLESTLSGVKPSDEVTAETWVYEDDSVRAVGFVDRTRDMGVLVTCGADLCSDLATAIILAKFIQGQLETRVETSDAAVDEPEGSPAPTPSDAASKETPKTEESSPTTEPATDADPTAPPTAKPNDSDTKSAPKPKSPEPKSPEPKSPTPKSPEPKSPTPAPSQDQP